MATVNGITQRFKGKVEIGTLLLGKGGIVDAASGIAGRAQSAQRVAIAVTAVANTDIPGVSIPQGATIESIRVFTTTAFTAVTDAQISVGATAGGADYVALTTIKALGIYTLTLVNAGAAALLSMPAPPNLFIRVVQTGGATAVGAATVAINYLLP